MVLEDYGELMFLQTVLKKLGFDVDAIQNPRSFGDSILRMNPDILVMTSHGKRVKGVELSRTLRRVRGLPRVIALRQPGNPQEKDAPIEGWLESPVSALDLIDKIADVAGLNKLVLNEKFSKLHMHELEEEKARVLKMHEAEPSLESSVKASGNFGSLQSSTMPSSERQERYKKFLEQPPPKEHGFAVKQVQEQVRNLRKEENAEDLEELERQRKAFVEHLFKKKA
jgi:hypothetical protein